MARRPSGKGRRCVRSSTPQSRAIPRHGGIFRVAFQDSNSLGPSILFFRCSFALPPRNAASSSLPASRAAKRGSRRIASWLCLRPKGGSTAPFARNLRSISSHAPSLRPHSRNRRSPCQAFSGPATERTTVQSPHESQVRHVGGCSEELVSTATHLRADSRPEC